MRDISPELMIALVFGAILLVRFLYRLLRDRAKAMQRQVAPEHQPAAVASTPPDAAPRVIGAPGAALPPASTRISPRALPRARRFSRAGLMPDRRAMQDAIVVATILEPCHAHRAHDVN
jgi:hypothetical protein